MALHNLFLHRSNGPTPLTAHIHEIAGRVSVVADEMMAKGFKAVLILATDGLPTTREGVNSQAANDEFIRALQQLQTLPIWLVVRLFTNEEEVVEFYNGLDALLEMNLVRSVARNNSNQRSCTVRLTSSIDDFVYAIGSAG